ncbi:hypothetical protein GGQ83_000081 [Roseococcus suduntuyensis]|uniref:DUF3108 domain-containing protein n=1 Tax=Roseococcus suduntuyensis TaxID=455361 RepID=A0A840A8Z2_9PROT|nr:DUF3108 domain-containing protein [Roseococcus suduntuyensis]MBB3896655.1 hypothetical protein [Roseococcus suduntuyensis]
MALRVIPLLLLLATPAAAEPWRATYFINAAGLPIAQVELRFALDGPGYSVETRARSLGVARLFLRGEQVSRSEGRWAEGMPQPRVHVSEGNWRGVMRRTRLEYGPDGAPRVAVLTPAQDMPRSPVPASAIPGTMDGLSALVGLARHVRDTATCETGARGFDGRRLTQFVVARDPAPAEAPRLRCVIEARTLAGYALDRDAAEAREPLRILAEFGPRAPGHPAVPERVELGSRWWGTIEATLMDLRREAPATN